jgi:aldehyde dehydrogenase (NAD+)
MVPLQRLSEVFALQRARRWEIGRAPAKGRVEKLRRLKKAIVAHREELLAAMHADFRKPRSEAELSELQLVLTELNHAIANVPRWMRTTEVATPLHMLGTRSEIRHEPRGVVLILAAWNYPFALLFAPLVAAVAAGNTVMLRPSERVPQTNALADRILAEAFEESEVALVGGGRETADALLAFPFDHVFFTGSTPVGRAILAAAPRHLPSVTLELGGKSPAIVDESADVAAAAGAVMWGKFVNAGQTCVAPDYALVHASRVQAFIEEARRALDRFYGASPELKAMSEDFCRIIDQPSFDRLVALVDAAVAGGASIEAGGDRNAAERYLAPTLLSGVDPGAGVMGDEIFGPVLPILTFTTRAEATAFVRDRPTPLVLYLFATKQDAIDEVLADTASGGAVVNNTLIHLLNPDLPFGGAGASGSGAYHGEHGFKTFSHERSVVYQRKPNFTTFFYPPYARLRSGLLGKILAFARKMRD